MRRWFIGTFAVCFVIALAAQTPLAVLASAIPALKGAQAYGSLWHGRLDNIRFAQMPPLTINLDGSPAQLLMLAYRADFDANARGLEASGAAVFGLTGRLKLNDGQALFDLASLPIDLPLIGSLTAQSISLDLNADGSCKEASGRLASDVLQRSGEVFGGWQGPLLDGSLSCKNSQLISTLAGKTKLGEKIEVQLSMSGPQLLPTGSIRIESTDLVLTTGLKRFGFRQGDDQSWQLSIEKGRLP